MSENIFNALNKVNQSHLVKIIIKLDIFIFLIDTKNLISKKLEKRFKKNLLTIKTVQNLYLHRTTSSKFFRLFGNFDKELHDIIKY